MEIKQLDINGRPIYPIDSGCMFTKHLVICQRNPFTKLTVRTQDQQLILARDCPLVRQIQHKNKTKSEKSLFPGRVVLNSPLEFLWSGGQHLHQKVAAALVPSE